MNFLAHLFLAGDNDESRVGSVLADFVRVPTERLEKAFGPRIAAAIIHHRRIDAYTDSHPLVNECVEMLFVRRRHTARIVVDIVYDHFLARNWHRFDPRALDAFIETCHTTLRGVAPDDQQYPERFRLFARRFVDHAVLPTYATLDGVALALERVASRISCGHRLRGGIRDIEHDYDRLEARFLSFFPELCGAFQSLPQVGVRQ